ncbi:tyrosine-protein kinase YwqD [Clostridium tepidiprofundi DSM 19306]|uniref:non-specific protein-tyrosine kinase n=1 Tax=Clostridium tepidiprofundi DSM 19306 TaxID=1121338 RepID=A0A151B3D9_9CLOT|nr:CpsD/CapB family tyrosine-protein kinase [Clostridium tepidiprofundi]KYH34272.1 tyrosine-protein kinase YwqD [Clostridium tepidiprofundi DSM 19306]
MLIVEKNPKSYISEAYRTLRTNIKYSSYDDEIKSILITSTSPYEGKSVTVSNLAVSMVQDGKKVLIVDCDLRRPTIHKKFGISNLNGLSNYLVGEISFEDAIVERGENLYIMSSGIVPPNPSEMLSSNKMKEFLNFKRDEFDLIILDSPPVLAVTDAQVLSTMVDGVILVVESGKTEKEALVKSKEHLDKVKANIIGVVINKIPVNKGKGYGYYYYYYYEHEKDYRKRRKRSVK